MYGLAFQDDDKFILAGFTGKQIKEQHALILLNADGEVDNSFGNEGLVTTDFSVGFDYAFGSVIQKDGKIVACESAGLENSDMALGMSRYTTGQIADIDESEPHGIGARAYPNPTDKCVTIEFSKSTESRFMIELYDLSTGLVFAYDINYQQPGFQIDLSALQKGVYLLSISNEHSVQKLKLIKQEVDT